MIAKAKKGVKLHTRASIITRLKFGEAFTLNQLQQIKRTIDKHDLSEGDVLNAYDKGHEVLQRMTWRCSSSLRVFHRNSPSLA